MHSQSRKNPLRVDIEIQVQLTGLKNTEEKESMLEDVLLNYDLFQLIKQIHNRVNRVNICKTAIP